MKKRRRRRNGKGIITVFVTLIMVPVVVCTGTIVDVARLKLYSSQAAMAADSYAEMVLGKYDNLLKELYGLFAITQDAEGIEAIETLAEYTKYSFDPSGGDKDVDGFMPYKSASVTATYEPIAEATLGQPNVMMTQIGDFMKYRVIEELLDESGLLSSLAGFSAISTDMDAVATRNEITQSCSNLLGAIGDYYSVLKTINDYSTPDYLVEQYDAEDSSKVVDSFTLSSDSNGYVQERIEKFEAYSAKLKYIVGTPDYKKYNHYMHPDNKGKIDEARKTIEEYKYQKSLYDLEYEAYQKDYEQYEKDLAQYEKDLVDYKAGKIKTAPTPPVEPEAPIPPEVPAQEIWDLEEQWVNPEYVEFLKREFAPFSESNLNSTSKMISFGGFEDKKKELSGHAKTLSDKLSTLDTQITTLEGQMQNSELLNGEENAGKELDTEISGLREITKYADDFQGVVDDFENNNNVAKDEANSSKWNSEVETLKEIESAILDGTQEAGVSSWATTISFEWYDFKSDNQVFYNQLQALCEAKPGSGGQVADKDAGDKEQQRAEGEAKKYKDMMDADEGRTAKDINGDLQTALAISNTDDIEVPDLGDCFTGGVNLKEVGSAAVGKFLLTTYDMNMFSSRVTGIEPPEDEDTPAAGGDASPASSPAPSLDVDVPDGETEEEEEYYDESLTGIKMSQDVNYLYGAEIEYLIAGHTGDGSSAKNQAHARNVICGVRMASNFVSTYTITQINGAISSLATAASAAVAAVPIIGPALAPVVRVAVSGALRAAVATMETYADWKKMMDREKVVFYKSSWDDLTSISELGNELLDFLGISSGDGDGTSGSSTTKSGVKLDFELSYENYLYIMMLLTVNAEDLSSRTADLITLNVNQTKRDDKSSDMTTLNFKMNSTVTAIKSTVNIDLDFVIVPENFLNMFIPNSNADAVIQELNDGGYGYSVIRGY